MTFFKKKAIIKLWLRTADGLKTEETKMETKRVETGKSIKEKASYKTNEIIALDDNQKYVVTRIVNYFGDFIAAIEKWEAPK